MYKRKKYHVGEAQRFFSQIKMNINLLTEHKRVVDKYFSYRFNFIADLISTHLQIYIRWNNIGAHGQKSS